jgi:hypothetical protein
MSTRTLANPSDRAAIVERLGHVRPETPRQWGRMTAPQMICHLRDAFRGVMGERPSSTAAPAIPRWRQRLMKFVALHLPLAWPRGMKTRPDSDQELGGTRPREFDADVAELVQICERFATGSWPRRPHFLFGPLSDEEWGRWGYRHVDHHLRQFGV